MTAQPETAAELQPEPRYTAREEAAGRLHAAVIDRLNREGIPIPPAPARPSP